MQVPSPFPGMDPYLESPVHWQDFHHEFISVWRSALLDRLPGNYFAKIDEQVIVLEPDLDQSATIVPDVLVFRDPNAARSGKAATSVLPTPTLVANLESLDPRTEPFIEILRLPEQEVVAVLELFSPTNKIGAGRGSYLEKRDRLMKGKVHIVELDLIRAGKHLQFSRPIPVADYYAFISRGDRRPYCEVFDWSIRDRMPEIPIPLKAPDPDISVDLQDVFRATYERGRYSRVIDYSKSPPAPPLEGEDAAWASAVIGASSK